MVAAGMVGLMGGGPSGQEASMVGMLWMGQSVLAIRRNGAVGDRAGGGGPLAPTFHGRRCRQEGLLLLLEMGLLTFSFREGQLRV